LAEWRGTLSEFIGKIADKADIIGGVYGYLAPMAGEAKRKGWSVWETIVNKHTAAIQTLNVDRAVKGLGWMLFDPASDVKPIFDSGIMALIAGYIVKELDVPYIGQYGDPIMKAGATIIPASIAAAFVANLGIEAPLASSSSSGSHSGSRSSGRETSYYG